MPNFIYNEITYTNRNKEREKQIAEFFGFFKYPNPYEIRQDYFSFKSIIPYPEEHAEIFDDLGVIVSSYYLRYKLEGNTSYLTFICYYLNLNEDNPDKIFEYMVANNLYKEELGKRLIEFKEKYGEDAILEWCIKNWGTKWDAFDQRFINEDVFTFHTAWDPPFPILMSLSEIFPDVTFHIKSIDIDGGFYDLELVLLNQEVFYYSDKAEKKREKFLQELQPPTSN